MNSAEKKLYEIKDSMTEKEWVKYCTELEKLGVNVKKHMIEVLKEDGNYPKGRYHHKQK